MATERTIAAAPPPSMLEAALWQLALPIPAYCTPCRARGKEPLLPAYQTRKLDRDALKVEFPPGTFYNLARLNGRLSGNRVVVDLDDEVAMALADDYLLATGEESGHGVVSARCHRFYVCPDLGEFTKESFDDPEVQVANRGKKKSEQQRARLIDLMGCNHVMIEPSFHESGERYAWVKLEAPREVGLQELQRCTKELAAAVLLAKHFPAPGGGYHDAGMAVVGMLVRAGWDERHILAFLTPVFLYRAARNGADEDNASRLTEWARSAAARLDAGDEVFGFPKCKELLGDKVAARLRDWLGLARATGDPFVAQPDRLALEVHSAGPEITARCIDALKQHNDPPHLFNLGDMPVRVTTGDTGRPKPEPLLLPVMSNVLSRAVDFYRTTKTGAVCAYAPTPVVQDLLTTPNLPLPPLRRVVEAPVFSREGVLIQTPGYHDGVLYAPALFEGGDGPASLIVPPVPRVPTAVDVACALNWFKQVCSDFPFADPIADRAAALAFALQPFARELYRGCSPLFAVHSPERGTGKGLLVDVLLSPALGSVPHTSPPNREEEWQKILLAVLMEARGAVVIDNVHEALTSPHLKAVLTSETFNGRILGVSRTWTGPNLLVWAATGNNLVFDRELRRRTLDIRLEAAQEHPEKRDRFTYPDLRKHARENRPYLVWAALVLIQHWVASGRPRARKLMGSFEDWSAIMGGILQAAGVEGLLTRDTDESSVVDSGREDWTAFTRLWWEQFKDARVVADNLRAVAFDLGMSFSKEKTDERERQALGIELSRQRGRIYDGLRVTYAGKFHNKSTWKLTKVSEPKAVAPTLKEPPC